MKKIIFIFSIFLIIILNVKVLATEWRYEWENTYIEVPLYASINAYDDIPKAKLYKDGIELQDANISYNRNGDWLYYYKDIDTSKPGEYKVWYKANESRYRPGTCNNYKQLITFKVIDTVYPTINLIKDTIKIPLNSAKIDYKQFYTVRDNLDGYISDYDDSDVNYKEIGTYEVKIRAIDISGNETKKTLKVIVEDNNGPVITFLGDNDIIEVEREEEVDFKEYFKAIDEIDKDCTSTISYDKFDINQTGDNIVTFTFHDKQGNFSSYKVTVRVVDEVPPTITLTCDNISLDYKTEPNPDFFKTFLVEAKDGIFDLTEQVEIDFSQIKLAVGSYDVIYKVSDSSGNVSEKKLLVNYVTDKAPEIKTIDVVINAGESIDFNDYIEVVDDSDPNVRNNISVDTEKFNNKEAGIYYLNVTVFNSSGLYNNAYIKVEVVDKGNNTLNVFNIIIIVVLGVVLIGGLTYYLIRYKNKKKLSNLE